jgi:hypothetical protein
LNIPVYFVEILATGNKVDVALPSKPKDLTEALAVDLERALEDNRQLKLRLANAESHSGFKAYVDCAADRDVARAKVKLAKEGFEDIVRDCSEDDSDASLVANRYLKLLGGENEANEPKRLEPMGEGTGTGRSENAQGQPGPVGP